LCNYIIDDYPLNLKFQFIEITNELGVELEVNYPVLSSSKIDSNKIGQNQYIIQVIDDQCIGDGCSNSPGFVDSIYFTINVKSINDTLVGNQLNLKSD
jgi:hypothetical protein